MADIVLINPRFEVFLLGPRTRDAVSLVSAAGARDTVNPTASSASLLYDRSAGPRFASGEDP